ncbi:hypothetical protein F4561_002210 [Lipingzhangella halophila]|uniref:Uncharacterized protein n=1 Tax=Lipingzhangella halophila TaxID=1783352 RepID=A0A7W7RG75_9ACTN|nr:hypothetical protein [Lipingzhangella halophila]MBB4931390.1 hypothetical protein [Lipingzhangella halophila]
MSEPTERADLSVPQAQQHTIRVLATLLAVPGLPAASWTISSVLPHELQGMLPRGSCIGLQAWAEAFGARVDWQRHDGDYPEARFLVNGVDVFVWTSLEPDTHQ